MNDAVEDIVDVPGGRLRFRWWPAASDAVLVFENGWGASHQQWAWVERELAGQAGLLFYSHAGIGGSAIFGDPSAARLSTQFVALLDALAITRPVVLVGHSFGGLISALHAAQQPERVAGIVQLDNTQEVNDAVLDKPLGLVKWLSALAILCSRLGLPDPVFGPLCRALPPEAGARMQQLAFGSPDSMRAALAELNLITDIRTAIGASRPVLPRLVISADRFDRPRGLLARLLSQPDAEMSKRLQHIQRLHRAQAAASGGSWMTLPHSHGDLVFTAAGAADTAREILRFVSAVAASATVQVAQ